MTLPDINNSKLLYKLQKLNENRLRDRILVPLLEKLGFDFVEVRHGHLEKGKDIVCMKFDELKEVELLVIVVTRQKLSGKASNKWHPHGVLNQLSQCITEPIKLRDGTERLANRIWLLTPYVLTDFALESSFAKIAESAINRIRIVDGLKLLSLLHDRAPELLVELGDKTAVYLNRIKEKLSLMQEAPAFHLNDVVSLLPLYINLDLLVLPDRLLKLLNGVYQPKRSTAPRIPQKNAEKWFEFCESVNSLLGTNPLMNLSDAKRIKDLANKTRNSNDIRNETKLTIRLNGHAFYRSIIDEVHRGISTLQDPPKAQIGSTLRNFHTLCNQVETILTFDYLLELLSETTPKASFTKLEPQRFRLTIEELLGSRINIQVVGNAGSGKTTLLRLLATKQAADRTGRLPVLVYLSSMTRQESLLALIKRACAQFGLSLSRTVLTESLESGKLLILLDGVDEAVAHAAGVAETIKVFMAAFPLTQIIVSTRPWAALRRNASLFTVQLCPFTDDQIKTFFLKWFAGQPAHAKEIIDHLDTDRKLYEIVSTPLVATIFAQVKASGGKLPKSLQDVYAERLRLLVHDWDAARGINRDAFGVSDKIFFLRRLAYDLHAKGIRTAPWDTILKLIRSTLGDINTEADAEHFAQELVDHNNVLLQHDDGNWGLVHLQYQEYLAALEAKENPRRHLASVLDDGWWAGVLEMYAQMTTDVSQLIYDAIAKRVFRRNVQALYYLLQLAPNTEQKAKAYLLHEWETGGMVQNHVDSVTQILDDSTAAHIRSAERQLLDKNLSGHSKPANEGHLKTGQR